QKRYGLSAPELHKKARLTNSQYGISLCFHTSLKTPISLDNVYSIDKSEPEQIPLWMKMCNVPLKAWTAKGINALASRIGIPLIMDDVTATMCTKGIGRVIYDRVLVEVFAKRGLPNDIEVVYRNGRQEEICRKSVKNNIEKDKQNKGDEEGFIEVKNTKAGGFGEKIPKTFQTKNKGLVAETFDWDEEEVSDDEEVTQVKVLIALADDELAVRKSHARNEPITPLPPLNILQGASPSSEVMPLTFQPHSLKERPGLDTYHSTTPLTDVASLRPITTVAAAPRLTAAAKGKQPARATSPYDPSKVERTEAEQLKIVLRRSRQETHISQHGGSSTDEGTGSKPGILKAMAKPFPPCTHCGFNDHRPDDCRNYYECEIYGSYDHFTSRYNHVIQIRGRVLVESSQSNKSSIGVKCDTCGSIVHSNTDHNEFYHFKKGEEIHAAKARKPTKKKKSQAPEMTMSFIKMDTLLSQKPLEFLTQEDNKLRRLIIYPLDEFVHEDDPSRQYQIDFDISYYVIPHGRSLSEPTHENQVPEVIAPNEPDIPHTKDTEGPPDLINTKGTPKQNIQNDHSTH
nr:RNA-directed DNA polymerase, eukaryota, reverse transcriptase zinc-binding domain protein [Tanacetum cinerariifolium]